MRRLTAVLLGAAVVVGVSACGETFEPAAAVVGGEEIRASQIDRAVEDFSGSEAFAQAAQGGERNAVLKDFERNYLGLLIRIAILEPEAAERDISVTDSDVDERIEDIKGGFPDEAAFEDAMAQQGLTLSALRSYVYQSELEGRVREDVAGEVSIGAGSVQEYYDTHMDEFTQVRSSHILVEDNETATAISDELRSTNPDELPEVFAAIAREQSIDTTSGERGGDLGFSNYGEFVEPFANALRELDVDEISPPVRSEFGFHLIYLKDRRITPLPEVEEQIAGQLSAEGQDEAWQSWINERYEAAEVSVNPRYGEFDPETQRIVAATPEQIPGAATPRPSATPNPEIAPSPQG